MEGSYLNSNACTDCGTNCLYCTAAGCDKCAPEFGLSATHTCENCPTNCKECILNEDETYDCIAPKDGFAINSADLPSPSDSVTGTNCANCDDCYHIDTTPINANPFFTCNKCASGYTL
jgi:hypothetical protein